MRKIRSLKKLRTTLLAIVARINFLLIQLVSLTNCKIVSKVSSTASQEPWFNRKLTRWSIIRRKKRPTRRRQALSDRTLISHHTLATLQIGTLSSSTPGGSRTLRFPRSQRSGTHSSSTTSGRRTHLKISHQIIKPIVHLILTELWRLWTALSRWL